MMGRFRIYDVLALDGWIQQGKGLNVNFDEQAVSLHRKLF